MDSCGQVVKFLFVFCYSFILMFYVSCCIFAYMEAVYIHQ